MAAERFASIQINHLQRLVSNSGGYRVQKVKGSDVGCVATSAMRHSTGNAPGMTALVEASHAN